MRIDSVVLREIDLELVEPFAISSGVVHHRRIVLVEVRDTEGHAGWGECVAAETPHYSPETNETAWLALERWIAPRVLGRDFERAADVHLALEVGLKGHLMARAALEMATWHLEAETRACSLAELLGGERAEVPVGLSIGLQGSPEALVAKALAARERGYRRIKLKIAPDRDLPFVTAVREALGPDAVLSVDANAAYSLDDLDLARLRGLDALGLVMIEQPLMDDDLRRHALLQAELDTPICLDESIRGPRDLEDALALGSGRALNIKPGRVGGHARSRMLHDLAHAADWPIWCGGMLETGIGRAHNVALASLPGFVWPGDISPSARYWREDVVDPEWTMSNDGLVRVPRDQPGLGVTVRRDRIDAITRRRLELKA